MDLLPASMAALGAVVGFIIGATLGQVVWLAIFGLDSSDIPPIVIGGLVCAVAFAWVGLRFAGRFAKRSHAP